MSGRPRSPRFPRPRLLPPPLSPYRAHRIMAFVGPGFRVVCVPPDGVYPDDVGRGGKPRPLSRSVVRDALVILNIPPPPQAFVGPGFRVVCVPPILREAPASFLFRCPGCTGNLKHSASSAGFCRAGLSRSLRPADFAGSPGLFLVQLSEMRCLSPSRERRRGPGQGPALHELCFSMIRCARGQTPQNDTSRRRKLSWAANLLRHPVLPEPPAHIYR
jgi:hypothetical protein